MKKYDRDSYGDGAQRGRNLVVYPSAPTQRACRTCKDLRAKAARQPHA